MMRFDPLLSGGQSVESQATWNAPPQHGQRGQQQRQVDLYGNSSRTVQYLAYRDGQQDERLEEGEEEEEEQRPRQQQEDQQRQQEQQQQQEQPDEQQELRPIYIGGRLKQQSLKMPAAKNLQAQWQVQTAEHSRRMGRVQRDEQNDDESEDTAPQVFGGEEEAQDDDQVSHTPR